MAQHNASQQQQQSSQQQQPQQQNGITQTTQVVTASQQNNNLAATYPHHYPMPGGVYVPTQAPHGGTVYSVMPGTLPGNVFVNNVTANVNLHPAWAAHPNFIPAGQPFIPANSELQQTLTPIEPVMQPIVNQQNTISRNGNRRNRNNSNPRNSNINRRNDYNQRPHLNSPSPQDIANNNGIDHGGQVLTQGYHHPYGYTQFACHQPQFFNHVQPHPVSHSQAQQATGASVYLASMYAPGHPFFNYPVIISAGPPSHMLSQTGPQSQDYQLADDRNPDGIVDQHGQPIHINLAGANMMQPHLWNPHEIPIEYQEEYHVMGNMSGNESNEDINQNTAVSMTDSEPPSLMSPSGYSIHYDPNIQLIEAQQHMSSLQIYDQHNIVNDEEVRQQQLIHEQQPDTHYPRMHEQILMISHEVNVYDPEQVCAPTEMIQELNSPVQQQIESQYDQYQQNPAEQEECYQQSHQEFREEALDNIEYKEIVNFQDFTQTVPKLQHENEDAIEQNDICAQNLNSSGNGNEVISEEQNYEPTRIIETKSELKVDLPQFVPSKNYYSSQEIIKEEEKIIQITHSEILSQNPSQCEIIPAVILPYQPLIGNQTVLNQPIETQTNHGISPPQIKNNYVPNQITKKTTASVAVTATPTQQHVTTHVGLSNHQAVPPMKSDVNANTSNANLYQPKASSAQNQKVNVSQNTVLPQRERKVQSNVQVEQKSIASTAVPHQIQENNYQQSNTQILPDIKNETIEQNNNNVIANKEVDTKTATLTSNQVPSGPKSWASLFSAKTSNNSVPANNSPSLTNTNANTTVNKKPIAKVLPFESTVNIQSNLNTGTLSYSAASAQGASASNKQSPISSVSPSSSTVGNSNQNGPVNKSGKFNQQNFSLNDNSDEWTIKYADYLKKYKTDFAPISLRPRGLKNPNNYCFINAVLQALVGCSPLYNLLKSAPKQYVAQHLDKSKIPTINAMSQFISEFGTLPFGVRLMNRRDRTLKPNQKQQINNDEVVGELQTDSAFEATSIYKLWNSSRPDVDEGRQGDAEEFLSYVLNKLNDEMLEIIKLMSKPAVPFPVQQNGNAAGDPDEGGDDDWQMIYNNRNKGSVTRQTDFGKTPISDIFRGELRSRLQREGEHSTDVIQPFFTLQLNIEKAGSVREALEILVGRDQLEGVTCSKTNQEVVAWQQMNLEKLPFILTVHLKFFDYKSDGCTKIVKMFEFPLELKIDTKILASKKYLAKQKLYRLFAVVYHDGKEAVKGHYVSDVYHSGYSSWLRYDDANVKPISESSVLRPRGLRVPYLLFYRRSDTIPSASSTSSPQQQQQQQQHQHGSMHSK